MKLIKEITGKEAGASFSIERFEKPYRLRKAVRAVLFNDEEQVAFQYVSKFNYHKLPGGGINEKEDLEKDLKREIKEEVGCRSKIGKEIGAIIEYRNEIDLIQISYCYFAKSVGKVGKTSYEKREIDAGHKPLWASINKAIDLLKKDETEDYVGKFVIARDLAFLETALEIN